MWKNIIKSCLPYGITAKFLIHPTEIATSLHPLLYNNNGEEILFIYLNDRVSAHLPYSIMSGRIPKRILWDRHNYALNLQMYGHKSILNRLPRGIETKQFGLVVESEKIIPNEYEQLIKAESDVKSLDALFTCSERLLDKYENAKFIIANGVWYGTDLYGGKLRNDNYERKKKLISIVASAKQKTPLHLFRANTARELKRKGLADAMGTSVGDYFVKISDAFDDYMYNVAIENDSTKYYFTEKILDCFASMTVPIYYGATDIGKFFNEDGIIRIKEPTVECVINAIKQCSKSDYEDRKLAIIENFERVKNYLSIDDFLTDNYLNLII
jgi:hypothetical protein